MNKKYNKDIMKETLICSSLLKSVLFLFFSILLSISVKAQNCQILDSAIVINDSCYGAGQASIELVLLDPLGSYSYNWSNGDTNSTAYNLSAGNYSVIINDNYSGCQDSTTFIITEASPIQITLTGVDVSCNGASDGSITSSVSGTGSFSYSWSSNNTPNNIAGFSYGGSHNGSYYYISNNQESWANANSISLLIVLG